MASPRQRGHAASDDVHGSAGGGGSPAPILTPWGSLSPRVDLFPLRFLLIYYGVVYFLPFGIFGWLLNEDGVAEWGQFLFYLGAFLCSLMVLWRRRADLTGGLRSRAAWQWCGWLLLALLFLFVAGEEISWGERISQYGVEWIRQINTQQETNIHNIAPLQKAGLLHSPFILLGLLAGWFGWRHAGGWSFVPPLRLSLYFLPVALFYAYFDISKLTLGTRIRNDQELFEFLFALGCLLHARTAARRARTP
jgi:hypothetical protein